MKWKKMLLGICIGVVFLIADVYADSGGENEYIVYLNNSDAVAYSMRTVEKPNYVVVTEEKLQEMLADETVDLKHFEDYNSFQNVEFVPEETFNCQELYGILDKCIKKILPDENCNIREIISEANREFRENYPDTVK